MNLPLLCFYIFTAYMEISQCYDIFFYGSKPDHAGSDASDGVISSLRFTPVKSINFIFGAVILPSDNFA